tara:strand:- start:2694 stop:2891 length:198 start_codon:yes stop_codon:yes gene_type:complete
MAFNRKRSEAMRLSWARRKAAALNGETIEVGRVVTAVRLARKLVKELGGNRDVAHALIDGTEDND